MISVTTQTVAGSNAPLYVYNNVLWRPNPANNKILEKSIDGGSTWTFVHTFTEIDIHAIIVTESGNILVEQGQYPIKLYLSIDGGVTFNLVLTTNEGRIRPFSFDVFGNTVFICEYGEYDGRYVYRSTDGGLNWTIVFTHPNPTTQSDQPNRQHMHNVHIDRFNSSYVYISSGDRVDYRGIWFSQDGGNNWIAINQGLYQPVFMQSDSTYLWIFDDFTGLITRASKSSILAGNPYFEGVYTVTNENNVSLSQFSVFYGARLLSNGTMIAGTVSYGADSSGNNEDAALLVGWNGGNNWTAIVEYTRLQTGSKGVEFISQEDNDGNVYILERTGNIYEVKKIQVLNNSEIEQKKIEAQTSTLTIKSS